MSLFSSEMRAELAKGVTAPGSPEVALILEMALPGGTQRVSERGTSSAAQGSAEPRLIAMPPIERGIDLTSFGVPGISVKAEIADPDFAFGRETERYRNSIRRSPVTLRLVSPNVADANAFSQALILGLPAPIEPPMRWGVPITGDDRALLGDVPALTISTLDWPDADPAILGTPVPLIYGTHSSVSASLPGMLPAYLVDRTGFRYLACQGWIQDIPRVWHDTTQQASSGWTVQRVTVNGVRYTLIDFTASPGTGTVRFDAAGYTDNAAGTSGTLITSPAAQAKHLLANFVFNTYRQGDWDSVSTTPIDESSFDAATAFESIWSSAWKGSLWIGERTQIREWMTSWAEGLGYYWFQAPTGKLAIGNMSHLPPSTLYPSEFIRADEEAEAIEVQVIDRELREIEGKYVHRAADGKYISTLRVKDLSIAETSSDTVEMLGSAAEV